MSDKILMHRKKSIKLQNSLMLAIINQPSVMVFDNGKYRYF
jgi:hypothetical protein